LCRLPKNADSSSSQWSANAPIHNGAVALPPWLTIDQVAEYCCTDRAQVYYKMMRDLEVRRIGVPGVMPFGRVIRIARGSLLRLTGQPEVPVEALPRWVTLKQAGDYYQVSPELIRRMIAHEQLDARRIGSSKAIRIDRESLLQLGNFRSWTT